MSRKQAYELLLALNEDRPELTYEQARQRMIDWCAECPAEAAALIARLDKVWN